MKRELNRKHYIEIESKHKKTNKLLLYNIMMSLSKYNIDKENITINDFYIDTSCHIERFILYSDKTDKYIKSLPYIEIELKKLYEEGNGNILYIGYQ